MQPSPEHAMRYYVLIGILSVIIGVGVYFLWDTAGISVGYAAEMESLLACSETDDVNECYRKIFGNITEKKGVPAAFALLAETKDRIPNLYYHCHLPVAHEIGVTAYKKFGNLADAVKVGGDPSICTGGYYHGVITEFMQTQEKKGLEAIGNKTCEEMEKNANTKDADATRRLLWQCYHGTGHGIMLTLNFDLPKALRYCDENAPAGENQGACHCGVFMENLFSAVLGEKHSLPPPYKDFYEKASNPAGTCTTVEDKYRGACYMAVPLQHLVKADGNYNIFLKNFAEKPFADCGDVPDEHKDSCEKGFGVVIGYSAKWNKNEITKYCSMGTAEEEKYCLVGATKYFQTTLPSEGDAFILSP